MVRVGTPSAVARPAWHDRNPIPSWQSYEAAGVAPHGATTRWTYTVPAGKKAIMEYAFLSLTRSGAPTTVGTAFCFLYYQPSGGSSHILYDASLRDATVGNVKEIASPTSLMLNAGDAVRGYTQDTSTGGTIDYILNVKFTEFDA